MSCRSNRMRRCAHIKNLDRNVALSYFRQKMAGFTTVKGIHSNVFDWVAPLGDTAESDIWQCRRYEFERMKRDGK